jgi:glutathione peroxidase
MAKPIYDISVRTIDGKDQKLEAHKGNVLLIVNVASKCGLTPQYEGLEKIYEQYKDKGFEVLGFPANEFGAQEPGTNAEIKTFCTSNYGVKFPMFEKIVVRGDGQHPLYKKLTDDQPAATQNAQGQLLETLKKHNLGPPNMQVITWNFEKFLVNRKGEVIGRFAPDLPPNDPVIVKAIEAELAKAA